MNNRIETAKDHLYRLYFHFHHLPSPTPQQLLIQLNICAALKRLSLRA